MKEDGVERKLVGEAEGHHNHAGDPEEKDVATRLKQITWEECFHVVSLLRPAHRREWEEA